MRRFVAVALIIYGLFAFTISKSFSQVVTTSPSIPIDNQTVLIRFDATKGDQGLIGYTTGDVYAHIGVITDKSTSGSDWKYVKAQWTENKPECKLTRISGTSYQLTLGPDIRSFFGVPVSDKILKIAIVFRNPDCSITGRDVGGADILIPVFQSGLNVSFSQPSAYFSIVSPGVSFPVQVNFTGADSAQLFLDGVKLKSSGISPLDTSLTPSGKGKHMLIASAFKGVNIASDTVWYLVSGLPLNQPAPAGMKDGINYIDNSTVTFVLYAPYKTNVYLIGDFNNWVPDSIYQFKKDGIRFWLTLSGLSPGTEYAFQYLIDGTLKIADPYCDKILDPWNDKYISATIYPGLKKYPDGKTTEIAGVIQTGQTAYNWDIPDFTAPAKQNLVIYELLIRDFTDNRDIKTVMDSIPYLKKLGINAIELMPFNEFEGNDSWGYNPDFYFAPDKAYGTKSAYKQFIDECHRNGIAVIQDMVLNHSYGQSPLVRMYFDGKNPTAQNPWYNQVSPNTVYSWGNDFNHESTATQYFVDRVTSYWLTEYKVDGFRFDFTKGFTNTPGDGSGYDASRIAILKRMANAIWAVKPEAYVILEHFTANSEEKELSDAGMMVWGNLNCAYNQASMGYASGPCSWDLSGISYQYRGWSNPGVVGYMESHDEERLMFKNLSYGNSSGDYNIKDLNIALKRMELASCFFYGVPGPKMLWEFGELGYDISIESGGRTSIKPNHWEYFQDKNRKELFDVTSSLIYLKETEPAFNTSTFTLDVANSAKQILLRNSNTEVHIIGNFDVTSSPVTVHFSNTGKWYDYFKADSIIISANDYLLTLEAGEFRILSNKKLSGFGLVILNKVPVFSVDTMLNVFPNPTSKFLTIDYHAQIKTIEVFSLEGKPVVSALASEKQIDMSFLDSGMYLLQVTGTNGEKVVRRIVKK